MSQDYFHISLTPKEVKLQYWLMSPTDGAMLYTPWGMGIDSG